MSPVAPRRATPLLHSGVWADRFDAGDTLHPGAQLLPRDAPTAPDTHGRQLAPVQGIIHGISADAQDAGRLVHREDFAEVVQADDAGGGL
jgi:hypothetical protein